MKTKIEDWDESILDIEDYQVERALANAALTAIHRARQFGTDLSSRKMVKPSACGQMSARLMKSDFWKIWRRINRKIAELQAKQSNAFELNERAEKPKNK